MRVKFMLGAIIAGLLMLGGNMTASAGPNDWCAMDCVKRCNQKWGAGTNNAELCVSSIVQCHKKFPQAPCRGTAVQGYQKKVK